MTVGGLEEQLMEYAHLNYGNTHWNYEMPQSLEAGSIRPVTEAVVVLDSKRIVYFLNTIYLSGYLVNVEVPGILVNKHYRSDGDGKLYSLVKPAGDEIKPAIERTIWFELTKMFGVVLPEKIRFDYWSYSAAAQRPQQRK